MGVCLHHRRPLQIHRGPNCTSCTSCTSRTTCNTFHEEGSKMLKVTVGELGDTERDSRWRSYRNTNTCWPLFHICKVDDRFLPKTRRIIPASRVSSAY